MLQVSVLLGAGLIFIHEITDGLCQGLAAILKNVMTATGVFENLARAEK